MTKHVARYTVTNGLAGCYMPDSNSGAMEFETRKELADMIRWNLDSLGWPLSKFHEVNIRRLWRHIAKHGSSGAHFSLSHKGYELAFHGLTEEEFNADQSKD